MKKMILVVAVIALVAMNGSFLWASGAGSGISSDEALSRLKEGNARYVNGTSQHPNQGKERRSLTASKGQQPFVTVLSCSDSRVPVEILFDSGIGDVFVIRVAGNVADTDEIGSIEYGVDHLSTPVLVVLGHTRCGAVTAVAQNAEVHGSIPPLVDNIAPAVASVRAKHPELKDQALIEAAVKSNVWQAIEDVIETSEAVRNRVKAGNLKILGAVYDLDSGKVEWLGSHPEQDQLMTQYGTAGSEHGKAEAPAKQ